MNVKIKKINEHALLPHYASLGASGADVFACLKEDFLILKPHSHTFVPTGIAIELENSNYTALLFARSGLSCKHGINLSNGVGVIDSDYRGEILVSLYNSTNEIYTLKNKQRIAQLLFIQIEKAIFLQSETLCESQRNTNGFGSTGE